MSTRGMTAWPAPWACCTRRTRRARDFDDLRRLVDPMMVEEAIAKKEAMLKKVRALHETNPMLGHRGVRLGISFPEIYKMQIRAILEAAAECAKAGIEVQPQIKVPQVCTVQELKAVKVYVDEIQAEVEAKYGRPVNFKFGTMIEVVRACMRAESLAEEAEFFSFGTNDLTQATFSFSREDAENKFLPLYNQSQILQDNPFEVLDVKGVGKLMKLAVDWGRARARTCTWASAASTAAIRRPSSSATRPGSTTSAAPARGCRWHAWPPAQAALKHRPQ
jgi:pyruvate,orthophosphate dikinase